MSEKFFKTMQELADYFHVTRMTIYRWSKKVPLFKTHIWSGPDVFLKSLSVAQANDWKQKVLVKSCYRLHYRSMQSAQSVT